ncbi:PD-(D/E)XK nuclease family transposase [Virgibacillus sp. FSP13]
MECHSLQKTDRGRIKDVVFLNTESGREYADDKLSRLDLLVITDADERVNVEIQFTDKYDMVKRSIYYWSRIYDNTLKKNMDYKELRPVISINILKVYDDIYNELEEISMKDKSLRSAFQNWEELSMEEEQRFAYESRPKQVLDEEAYQRNKELFAQEKETFAAEKKEFIDEKKELTKEKKEFTYEKKELTEEKKAFTQEKEELTAEKEIFIQKEKIFAQEKELITLEKELLNQERELLRQERKQPDRKFEQEQKNLEQRKEEIEQKRRDLEQQKKSVKRLDNIKNQLNMEK